MGVSLLSFAAVVTAVPGMPAGLSRPADGTWTAGGQPVDSRLNRLLDLAWEYDQATAGYAEHTSVEHVARIDDQRYLQYTFADAAALLLSLLTLEHTVGLAREQVEQARMRLGDLHDRSSMEAVSTERRMAVALAAVQETFDRQERRVTSALRTCSQAVADRQHEALRARQRAEDRRVIADVEQSMSGLRDIADEAARIVRSSRLREGLG